MKNLHTRKTSNGSNFGWLIRQMSIIQKRGRHTFRTRFASSSLFVSHCPAECNFQSETKIEPDLRLRCPPLTSRPVAQRPGAMRRRTSGERGSRRVNSGCWWSLNIRFASRYIYRTRKRKGLLSFALKRTMQFFKTWSPFLESPDSLSGPEKVIYACSVCIET